MNKKDRFGPPGAPYDIAGTVIRRDNGFLLVQERQPRAYKLWCLPAGRFKDSETAEDTAIRETLEETGFKVELMRPLLIDYPSGPEGRPLLNSFEAKISGGKLTVQTEELFDARFFTLSEITELDRTDQLRHPWVIESIKLVR